jgi:hypothetical protein
VECADKRRQMVPKILHSDGVLLVQAGAIRLLRRGFRSFGSEHGLLPPLGHGLN